MAGTRPIRGATLNGESTRFNLPQTESDGDWLDEREALDGARSPVRTTVTVERAKTIISRNTSPDVPFDRSINPYRGCEHGCIYCFARPSHAFHDLSPGLDFETKLFAKPDAAALLRAGTGEAVIHLRADRDGDEHRSVPADRARVADHARGDRGAGGMRSSAGHHHQVRSRRPRYRPARADGGERAGRGGDLGDVARPEDRDDDRAARAASRAAADRGPAAGGCRSAGVRQHGAGDPGDHRSRGRGHRRTRSGIGGDRGFVHPGAVAVGGRAAIPRLARRAFPRARGQGDGDDPEPSRRQGQRP